MTPLIKMIQRSGKRAKSHSGLAALTAVFTNNREAGHKKNKPTSQPTYFYCIMKHFYISKVYGSAHSGIHKTIIISI